MSVADEVRAMVRVRPGLSPREIAEAVGCARWQVSSALQAPRRARQVSPHGTIVPVALPDEVPADPVAREALRRLRLGWWRLADLRAEVPDVEAALVRTPLLCAVERGRVYPLRPGGSVVLPDGSTVQDGAAVLRGADWVRAPWVPPPGSVTERVLQVVQARPGITYPEVRAALGEQDEARVASAARYLRRTGRLTGGGVAVLTSEPGRPMPCPLSAQVLRRLRCGWWRRAELVADLGPRAEDALRRGGALREHVTRSGIYPLHPDGSITLPDGSRMPHGAAAWAARRVA